MFILIIFLVLIGATGCGILLGNVKPVAEKSQHYSIVEPSKKNANWVRITKEKDRARRGREHAENEISDLTFQSRRTASIISLNSSCRERIRKTTNGLRSSTNLLLMGLSGVKERSEKTVTVASQPALQTTVRGKINNEEMMVRAVVLRRRMCMYDLMYVALPRHFGEEEKDFAQFVASFHLR